MENQTNLGTEAEKTDINRLKLSNWDISHLTVKDVQVVKKELRDLGRRLQEHIARLKFKYAKTEFEPEFVAKSSSKINDVERKASKYLSIIMVESELNQRRQHAQCQLIKYKQQYLDAITARYRTRYPGMSAITGQSRARQMADRLTNMFQTDWQDMYKALREVDIGSIPDKDICTCIRQVLQFCNKNCMRIANQQNEGLGNLLYVGKPGPTDVGVVLAIKELKESTVSHCLPHLQKTIFQLFKVEKSMRTVDMLLSVSKPPLRTFLNKCTELLWYMQVQEPPVYLEFSPTDNPLMYQPLTDNSSQLDFIIWPAVKLHKHGPGIRKGVALFSEIDCSSKLYVEYEDNEREDISDTDNDPNLYYFFKEDTKKFYYFTK